MRAGACVPPGDVNSFAAALRELVKFSRRRAHAGLQARLLAEQRFGMESVLSSFEHKLCDLAENACRRPSAS